MHSMNVSNFFFIIIFFHSGKLNSKRYKSVLLYLLINLYYNDPI